MEFLKTFGCCNLFGNFAWISKKSVGPRPLTFSIRAFRKYGKFKKLIPNIEKLTGKKSKEGVYFSKKYGSTMFLRGAWGNVSLYFYCIFINKFLEKFSSRALFIPLTFFLCTPMIPKQKLRDRLALIFHFFPFFFDKISLECSSQATVAVNIRLLQFN